MINMRLLWRMFKESIRRVLTHVKVGEVVEVWVEVVVSVGVCIE